MIGNLISAGLSLFGANKAQKSQERMARENIALQKQFAQEGIQWKVADAKAAGIHPLYALGAQTHSFSPVSVGDNLSAGWANAGQDIGRAVNAMSDGTTRIKGIAQAQTQLALERAGLENELLRSQIRRNNSAGNPPPAPGANPNWFIPGQGAGNLPQLAGSLVTDGPLERTGVNPAAPHTEAGTIPDLGYTYSSPGYYYPVPSADVKKRIEDMTLAEWSWSLRHQLGPMFGYNWQPPPGVRRLPYQMWRFDPALGYYKDRDPHHDRRGRTRYFSPNRRLY